MERKSNMHKLKILTSKQLIETSNIDFPYFQRDINYEKVEELKKFIEENPYSLIIYFPIIIGYISEIGYIIDGQHRLEAIRRLYIEEKIVEKILVQEIYCATYEELKIHFMNINKNSPLDKFYSNIDNNFNDILLLFKKHIKDKYKNFLSNSENPRMPQINIEKAIIELSECEQIIISNGEFSADILIKNFEIANNRVYEYLKHLFETYGTGMETSFYSAYLKMLDKSNDKGLMKPMTLSFPLNWVELLINPENEIKIMNKYKKVKISKPLRIEVWDKWMGKVYEGPCPVCKSSINFHTFEVGHIVSEKKGGETSVYNCRPICGSCNKSMGAKSFYEFMKNE